MSVSTPVRETREVLLERAREAIRLAKAETVPNRARIHIQAAETWLRLAARKPRADVEEGAKPREPNPV
ncbi:hypothetical protein [Sphingomonas colocasiae]|uniref:DUF3618 domain-containing protein n=1 Tax=Sphingomonas colocasiae TaxID=1848973 RepID=A0ABS7PQ74_9SPHN|nr:hypothetical protein [Sphingomonas colocasiae]MBY8823482.1 hypothetical protein [Sphingomonas colocasiae]